MKLPPPPDRWTIEIANAERINAISSFGFTERQDRFLVNVLLHAGVFVERQYCAFAGIVHAPRTRRNVRSGPARIGRTVNLSSFCQELGR